MGFCARKRRGKKEKGLREKKAARARGQGEKLRKNKKGAQRRGHLAGIQYSYEYLRGAVSDYSTLREKKKGTRRNRPGATDSRQYEYS